MGKATAIEWADHTFNPWWGCQEVSAACDHCYACTFAKRIGQKVWGGDETPRRFFGEKHWLEPLQWAKAARKQQGFIDAAVRGPGAPVPQHRPRVFCASMADVFEDREDLIEPRARLFRLIEETADALDWMILTKRPENIVPLWPRRDAGTGVPGLTAAIAYGLPWLGTTVENRKVLAPRIDALFLSQHYGRLLFLSCEPLRECIRDDLSGYVWGMDKPCDDCPKDEDCECEWDTRAVNKIAHLSWVIAGGESGGKSRPSHPDWFRRLRAMCATADIPFFFKQWGDWHPTPKNDRQAVERIPEDDDLLGVAMYRVGKKHAGRELDGETHGEFPSC